MKLKSARIQNFKLLRDVRLEFAESQERPLTVIRAENGSGKTSTLVALRWALYGKEGLVDASVRLSPASWPDGTPCEIKIQLDFSHTLYNQIAGEFVPSTTDYRLVRSAIERPEGDRPNRGPDQVLLYQMTDGGLDRIDPPEPKIEQMLPIEMKDIFFTDGDAALTFVSPQLSKSSKSDQVRDAIRSLLGLGILEKSAGHITSAQKRYNASISKTSGLTELADLADKISKLEENLDQNRARFRDVEHQIEDLGRRYAAADKRLELALQAGDYTELASQKEQARTQIQETRRVEQELKGQHQKLIQDERFSLGAMQSVLQDGFRHLVALHDAGVIPSGSIPVIEERLDLGVCICGTELTAGSRARATVEDLIERQRGVDNGRKILTELHHAAKADLQRVTRASNDWLEELGVLEKSRLNNRKIEISARDQLRICEEKLARIDQANVDQARKDRDSLRVTLNAKEDERRELQTKIDGDTSTLTEIRPRYDTLRQSDRRVEELNAQLTVTQDILTVVDRCLTDIQQTYVGRVSSRMSELFLEMVGADRAKMEGSADTRLHSHVFRSASITPRYEIAVHTSDNKTLDPDHELNGASKRALTFSFIWALTEVSGIIAPRIIDTPLGMMSGAVKKRVLELITSSGTDPKDIEKQVILFLTRDEIRGIEDVIDLRAGKVLTFTNSDQYPVDVTNDPHVTGPEIVTCECNHRQKCKICERRNDALYSLSFRNPM